MWRSGGPRRVAIVVIPYALPVTKQLSVPAVEAGTVPATRLASAFARRFWVPLLLMVMLAGLTGFGITGSSAAAIRESLGVTIGSDPNLVAGSPLGIRSDEWAINTPLTIMQLRTGMPRIQPLLGNGADMALSYDVPVADLWAVFRPQHWGFLVLPMAQGFAVHWWLPALLLVFALWLLTVTLLPGRNVLGLLIGVAAVFSPFLQWWYLAGSFLPEALAVLACALFIRIVQAQSRWLVLVYSVLMTWALASFVLLLYPPFQIPCALVAVAFCLGYLILAAKSLGWSAVLVRLGVVVGCGVISGAFVALFALDHLSAVEAIASSVYPGHRTVESGGYPVSRLFSGFLDRGLTGVDAAKLIDVNQSEASSPLLAGLFVAPVLAWFMLRMLGRSERPNPVILLLLAVLSLFLAHLFLPAVGVVAEFTLLDKVPGNRLLLGLGMLSDLLLIAAAWQFCRSPALPRLVILGAFCVPFLALSALALHLNVAQSAFVGSPLVAGLLAAAIGVAVALSVTRRPELGAGTLVLVSFLVAGTVNPLSTGVTTTDELPIGVAVARIDRAEPGGWIMQLDRLAMGVLTEQRIHSYSVVYNYPQIELWRELDPTGAQSEHYNRYGYVDFSLQRGPTRFPGHSLDGFYVAINGCAPFVQNRVKHILTDKLLDAGCLRLRQTVISGSALFYVYDVIPPLEARQTI